MEPPFSFWVPLLKPNSRKKGTLIIKGLLGNLVKEPGNHILIIRAPSTSFRRTEVQGRRTSSNDAAEQKLEARLLGV